jgi:hypothetical protein
MTNKQEADEGDRILVGGQPALNRCNNKVVTSKYSLLSFLPLVSLQKEICMDSLWWLAVSLCSRGALEGLARCSRGTLPPVPGRDGTREPPGPSQTAK